MEKQDLEIKDIIRTLTDKFELTFAKGDLSKLSEFYTENGMLLPAGFDFIIGKKDIKEFWQSAVEMGIKQIKIDIIELEQHDDTAIEMSNYTLSDSDNQLIDSGKGIVIWKKKGDAWKMHRDIWTSSLTQ